MSKNKTIIFFLITAAIAIFLPAVALAAGYECWCVNIDTNVKETFIGADETKTKCDAGCTYNLCATGNVTSQCLPASAAAPATKSSSDSATDVTKVLINPIGGTNTNVTGITDPTVIIGTIIKTALGIVGSIALLMFIYGGFLWLTSMGNEKKITEGKNVIVWAVIGLIIIFLSYTLVGFVIKAITGGTAAK